MDIIVIDGDSLKIMMTDAEARRYGIDTDGYLSGEGMRERLGRVLSDPCVPREIVGFCDGFGLWVELYPSGTGCEIFVRRAAYENIFEGGETDMDKNEERSLIPRVASIGCRRRALTYSFGSLGDAICACRAMGDLADAWESALYVDASRRFYLYLKQDAEGNEKSPPPSFLSEFGELESTEKSLMLLSERGRLIFPSLAIQNLKNL